MRSLKELGYIQEGMVLVDQHGKEATITGIYGNNTDGFTLVELNNNPTRIMWNWDRLNPEIKVKEISQ